MKIALGADHGAFELKEAVKKHLEEKGIEYKDFGCFSKESVDYPVYASMAAMQWQITNVISVLYAAQQDLEFQWLQIR